MNDTPAVPELEPLVGPDSDAGIPAERRPWRRHGIYWSDICLAVHLSPAVSHWTSAEQEAAKATLYLYLRGLHQTALELGLVYPVACVLSDISPVMKAEMRRWSSDQEWHRGAFTVYFAEESPAGTAEQAGEMAPAERLEDVLVPKPEALTASQEQQALDVDGYIGELEMRLARQEGNLSEAARPLAEEVMTKVRERIGARRTRTQTTEDDLLKTWRDERIVAAHRLL